MRNEIYELACINGPIAILPQPSSKGYKGASGLLHTCRQIRFEVQPIFYRHTIFNLGMPREEIGKIDRLTREHIKSIGLDINLVQYLGTRVLYAANSERARLYRAMAELGKSMPNIEHLYVEVDELVKWEAHRLPHGEDFRMHTSIEHVKIHYQQSKRE